MSDKKRRPNWSSDESLLLTDLVKNSKPILEGRLHAGLTSAKKHETWQVITDEINASFCNSRTREEVEKKWKNLKMNVRKEVSYHRSQTVCTGGGPPPDEVTALSESVLDVMGKDNVTITGIPQGIDSTSIQMCVSNDSTMLPTAFEIIQSVPSTSASSESFSGTTSVLLKRKVCLEIEYLKLKKEYLTKKIMKLEEHL